MRNHTLSFAVLICVLLGLTAVALADDLSVRPEGEQAALDNATGGVDPTGTWNFVLSGSQVAGMCPMGGDGGGTLNIGGQSDALVIQYITGMTCAPPEVCVLFGSCQGSRCMFSTTVTVDDEGGKVTNSADLTLVSPDRMEGTGGSVYVHPEGFTCSWAYNLTLTR